MKIVTIPSGAKKDAQIIKMSDSRISSKFSIYDQIKVALNCLKPKIGGVQHLNDQDSLFSTVDEVYSGLKNK
ncbi:MAG: hypothetical protein ACK56I_08495 [bacterium]